MLSGLQLAPGGVTPSSTLPLQSLSFPSQTSGLGPTTAQVIFPPEQVEIPDLHSPTLLPQATPTPGIDGWPGSGGSSTTPSQSLSRPSHTSGVGPAALTLHSTSVPFALHRNCPAP